ncbi:hypothetical protein ACVWW5_005328 [Bradyrhizobium sp. LM3.4]
MLPQVADQPRLHQKPPPASGEFLQHAISNARSAFPFPSDIHYMIARGGFFSRLSKL